MGDEFVKPVKGKCRFFLAWVGYCKAKPAEGSRYCNEHLTDKCGVCGKQATKQCSIASSLVCGYLLCNSKKCKDGHYKDRNH